MIAKQTGGDAASGTYIGFYDCHVAPAQDWFKELWLFVTFHKCIPSDFDCSFFIFLQETIDLLAVKERRLVVPMIAALLKT